MKPRFTQYDETYDEHRERVMRGLDDEQVHGPSSSRDEQRNEDGYRPVFCVCGHDSGRHQTVSRSFTFRGPLAGMCVVPGCACENYERAA